MSLEFLLTALIVVASPGTGVLITLAAGLARGRRASLVAALGCTLGIVPHLLAAVSGLAALLQGSPLAFEILRALGVAYLLFMAWQSLRETGSLAMETGDAPQSDRQVIASAILANLLNPKLSLFFFAFLPQFIDPREPQPVLRMLELGIVFMAMTLAVFVIYGLFAAAARRHVLGRPGVLTAMRRLFAGAFVALALRLALAER